MNNNTTPDSQISNILNELSSKLELIQSKMPNGELKVMQHNIEQITQDYRDLKADVSEIKHKLLNPETGVIVKVNKNTEHRKEKEEFIEQFEKLSKEHDELMSFKKSIKNITIAVVTAISALITDMILNLTK